MEEYTKVLRRFASFVRENFLQEMVKENLSFAKKLDIPLMRFFSGLSEEELSKISQEGIKSFLTDLENGKEYERSYKSLKQWEDDEIPGIPKEAIEPSDLVLVNIAQKQALFSLIPKFTTDSKTSMGLVQTLEQYYTTVQNGAFKLYTKMKREADEKIKYHLHLEELTATISTLFAAKINVDINNALEIITKDFQADRGFIYFFNDELSLATRSYSWPKESDREANVSLTSYKWAMEKILNKEIILIEDFDAVKKDFLTDVQRNNDIKIKSLITLPVNSKEDKVIGLIGFSFIEKTKIWSSEEMRVLGIINEILVAYLDRKRVEETLQENVEFVETILDTTPNIILIYDLDEQRNIYSNNGITTIMGYTPKYLKELGSSLIKIIVHPDDISIVKNYQHEIEVAYDKQIVDVEFRAKHANGSWIWINSKSTPLKRDSSGKVKQYLTSARDITAYVRAKEDLQKSYDQLEIKVQERTSELTEEIETRQEIEKELARSNKELEQFAYIISHDLQSPLRTITSYIQLLERRYKSKLDDDAQQFIKFAVDGTKKMSGLLNGVLEYSKHGEIKKELKLLDLNDLLLSSIANIKALIDESQTVINISSLPSIKVDEIQMMQLFQNLISNAIKYRNKEITSVVDISAELKVNGWVFSISDNGIGIKSEDLERIFIMFQRSENTDDVPGQGIGLAICKRIIERHKGRIWVESIHGKGSTFFFTLPDL